jgi:hypothetical protein
MERVQVRFIKSYTPFVAGDVTLLEKEVAKRLLDYGVLVIFGEEDIVADIKADLPDVQYKPDKFICPICGKEMKTEASLKAHKNKVHKL